jgi:predicted Zn-dependent peptidase
MIHPEIKEIEHIDLLKHEKIILNNGLPLYVIKGGKQPLLKVDVLFDAGKAQSKNPILPAAVNAMLNDGCRRYSSKEIAQIIDGKGAFYVPNIQKDFAQTSIYLLSKFAQDLLPLYMEMINESIFPEEEVLLYKNNMKQRFLVEQGKVNVQSNKAFVNALFGKNSIYADNTSPQDYDDLLRDEIVAFYEKRVENRPTGVIVSGLVDDKSLKELVDQFGDFDRADGVERQKQIVYGAAEDKENWIIIPGNNNQQVSMRIGIASVAPDHPDYWGLSLLSTVLGGYFGSRLNKVIREEKGLTYGIHSQITTLKKASFLSIHAELNAANWKEAYEAVLVIFEELKSTPISQRELDMVRRYIKGNLLQSVDGAFAFSSYLKNSIVFGLDQNRINQYISFLDSLRADQLMQLATQYLNEKSFYKIVAGV